VALMRTPSKAVSAQLRELGLIKICISLFFAYPWNNLLHGSVEHIIQMVVSGECTVLKTALFADCDFLTKILEARKLSAAHREEKKFRLGYMGHITRVSNTIVEFAKHNAQLDEYMQQNAKWLAFINEELKLENEQLNTQLGGHRPNNGLSNLGSFSLQQVPASATAAGREEQGGDGDGDGEGGDGDAEQNAGEFTLFTLNDDMDSNSNDDEEEHSSEEEDNVEEQEKVVLAQDAFEELTAQMDSEEKGKVSEVKEKEKDAEQKAKDAQFESWLNDEDGWADFDDNAKSNGKEKAMSNGNVDVDGGGDDKENNDEMAHSQPQSQSSQQQPAVDDKDFANWDEDPFPNDDVFGAPEAAADVSATSSEKAKSKEKDIQNEAEDTNSGADAVTAASD